MTTTYELPSSLLSANPLNRYPLNSPIRPNFKRHADGGPALFVRTGPPGRERFGNWLPAPKGDSLELMLIRWPSEEAIAGKWTAPPMQRAQ